MYTYYIYHTFINKYIIIYENNGANTLFVAYIAPEDKLMARRIKPAEQRTSINAMIQTEFKIRKTTRKFLKNQKMKHKWKNILRKEVFPSRLLSYPFDKIPNSKIADCY